MKATRFCAIFIAFCLSICTFSTIASATDTQQYTKYLEDGSYFVTTITHDTEFFILERVNTKQTSGKKVTEYYNKKNELLLDFCVYGTFTYDGHVAEATNADYSYNIYDSEWINNSASAYCSGASAIAQGTFTGILRPVSITSTLTCSADGKLS